MDDNVQTNSGMADFGGIIRDCNREFMHGLHGNIGYLNILPS